MHTLSGEELYMAHLTPFLQQASVELEVRVRETQQDNYSMIDTIQKQRQEIEMLMNELEGVVRDIGSSVESMSVKEGNGVQDLKGEAWTMEQEVAATR